MSHWITMVTAHGPMNGWLADPDDRPVGGIVLVHEIFGVNADMRRTAERYAAEGYLTVVPALFDKIQREVELDYTADASRLGTELASRIGAATTIELVETAADAISHAGKVAIIGYGWGGFIALRAAQKLSAPCISYYDAYGPSSLSERLEIPALIHCGELDTQHSSREWLAHKDNLPKQIKVFSYVAGNAFDREGDSFHYHAKSSDEAFQHNRNFLNEHIRTADNTGI